MVAIGENSMPGPEAIRRTQPLVNNPYQGGINLYGHVDSWPEGSVDAEGTQRFMSTPIRPAPPPGSAGALLQQYSGRNAKNYPPNLPPPYDGLGGAVLGPLLAGGWHFTGLTGREVVGYADIHTVKIGNGCARLGHPVYAPTAQIARGGNAALEWASDLVDGMAGIGVAFVVAAASSETGPGTIFVGGIAGGFAAAGVNGLMTGEPLQTRSIRVYGPTWVGQTWVEVGR